MSITQPDRRFIYLYFNQIKTDLDYNRIYVVVNHAIKYVKNPDTKLLKTNEMSYIHKHLQLKGVNLKTLSSDNYIWMRLFAHITSFNHSKKWKKT